jgi:formate-dependent nitrite reductase membrane component NrfD
MIFGFFSFLSFMAALAEEGDRVRPPALRRLQWKPFRSLLPPAMPGRIVAFLGGLAGLFIAGYTGVLLAVTNRPIWSDTPLLGMVFIISAASTSAALLLLLSERYGWRALPGVAALARMDGIVLVLELIAIVALMISLGPVLQAWLNVWGLLWVFGVIILGIVVPLVLAWRRRGLPHARLATTAMLVLIGGFLLRFVVIFSSEMV